MDTENPIPTLTREDILVKIQGEKDQYWMFRTLLLLNRVRYRDLKEYRRRVGKVENRNLPDYLLQWSSNTQNLTFNYIDEMQRTMTKDMWRQKCRTISGRFVSKFIELIENESVMNLILEEANRYAIMTNTIDNGDQ